MTKTLFLPIGQLNPLYNLILKVSHFCLHHIDIKTNTHYTFVMKVNIVFRTAIQIDLNCLGPGVIRAARTFKELVLSW